MEIRFHKSFHRTVLTITNELAWSRFHVTLETWPVEWNGKETIDLMRHRWERSISFPPGPLVAIWIAFRGDEINRAQPTDVLIFQAGKDNDLVNRR